MILLLSLGYSLHDGRQLLEDFNSDRRHTIYSMAAVRRPSSVLRRLSIALAGVCVRLEQQARDSAMADAAAELQIRAGGQGGADY